MAEKLRALLIDDSELTLDFLRMLLNRGGIETRAIVELGELEAELADGWRPDVVVADVNMPDLLPGEICARVRAEPRLSSVPIVLCSGMEANELATVAAKWHADGFASKADGLDSLPRTLEAVCETRRAPAGGSV
jgi:PleD family two-component response regulator